MKTLNALLVAGMLLTVFQAPVVLAAADGDDVSLRVVSGSELAGSPDLSRPLLRVPAVTTPPHIDGSPREPSWDYSVWAGPFVALEGTGFPEEQTAFSAAADQASLYVAVRCREALLDPALQRTHEIKAAVSTADGSVTGDDCVEVLLKPQGSSGICYHFAVNPGGVLYDARVGDGPPEVSWDSHAQCAAWADTTQWCVELAIPLDALGGKPAAGAEWGLNVLRRRSPGPERSAWVPIDAATSGPGWGILTFGASPVGVTGQHAPGFETGDQAWRFELQTDQPVFATVLSQRGDLSWNALTGRLGPTDGQEATRFGYSVSLTNLCLRLEAPPAKGDKTLCLRTDRLPVEAGREYRFLARVKSENVVAGARPIACSISSYDAEGNALKTYEPILRLPEGSTEWVDVKSSWRAPPTAATILFWVVKWGGGGGSGTVLLDDLRLTPRGGVRNVLPNGEVEADQDGAIPGWRLFAGAGTHESYGRSPALSVVFALNDAQGRSLYRSIPYRGTVIRRITDISASLLLKAGRKDSDNVHRVRHLWVNEGGTLAIPVALRSSHPERYQWADVVLDVPDFIHLIPPAPRADITKRHTSAGRRTYRIRFGRGALSPVISARHNTVVTLLVAECGVTPGGPGEYEVQFHAEVEDASEDVQAIPLHVLPPLGWIRPEIALIKHWACSSFYRPYRRLTPHERDAIAALWRQAGFNRTGAALDAELRDRYGFSARGHIPLINAPGSLFPGGAEYLAAHPEARAVSFEGRTLPNAFCPTYFLSEENGHLREVRNWLAEEAKRFPHMDWDYEVPVTRDTSICACDRCLQAFRKAAELPPDTEITRENVRTVAGAQWVTWRCRENARIAEMFRQAIKTANPDCLFSIYSGYQGSTDEKYGVDWRFMAVPADVVWAGYGRPVESVKATHEAIDGRPFICGELAWFGIHPWRNEAAQTALFRRLSDGGSGIMTYFNWIVDGRFYQAVSRCAAVVADFEPFFRWDIDADGTYHSRYQRMHGAVSVVSGGAEKDVTVLGHRKDRLVFVFNETGEERAVALVHHNWEPGMAVVDVERKASWGAEHGLRVPARDVRVLHVRAPGQPAVAAPRVLAGQDGSAPLPDPIVAWQGRGSHPGDQRFEVQISRDPRFPEGGCTVLKEVVRTALLPRDLAAGVRTWWRVRGQDAVTGLTGPWSETGCITRGMFSEPVYGLPAFSPNGDGILDTFELTAELSGALPWEVCITDSTDELIRSFKGSGCCVSVSWDGTTRQGVVAAPGTYRYRVIPAGREAQAVAGECELNPKVGLANPGFEVCRGFILSVPSGRVLLSKDYRNALSDTYALRLQTHSEHSRAYWSNYAGGGIGSNIIPVTPGATYTFAAQVRTELSAGYGGIALAFFTDNGRWAQVPGKPPHGVSAEERTGTTDWAKQHITLTAPDDAFSAVLFFKVEDASGTVWFDRVSFTEERGNP